MQKKLHLGLAHLYQTQNLSDHLLIAHTPVRFLLAHLNFGLVNSQNLYLYFCSFTYLAVYFDSALIIYRQCAVDALHDMSDWLDNKGGEVAVSILRYYLICHSYTFLVVHVYMYSLVQGHL